MRLFLPRLDADQVSAELAELGQHELVQAFADGGQQDHRRNTDGDAQAGEETAQPVGDEAGSGEADQVGE